MSTIIAILTQIWFCLPVWIAVAALLLLWRAAINKTPETRTLLRRWAAVFGFVFLTSLLWANPWTMIFYSGPFAGRVVDADSGEPIAGALLVFNWRGGLGSIRSEHHASTVTDADGKYELGWQGFANWRVGAEPEEGSVFVNAPGYAAGRLSLNGVQRDQWRHDPRAKSATMVHGEIRLQRLRPNTRINHAKIGLFSGIDDASEHLDVVHRFYDEVFPRLCPSDGQHAEWAPANTAFFQLRSIIGVIDPNTARTARWLRLWKTRLIFTWDQGWPKKS